MVIVITHHFCNGVKDNVSIICIQPLKITITCLNFVRTLGIVVIIEENHMNYNYTERN